MAADLWSGVLRRGDDAHSRPQVRHGQVRRGVQSVAQARRRYHRGWNGDKQDGARPEEGLRPDARPQVGHLHGQLRQRRWILPLQLLRSQGLRQDHTRGHLRAR